MSLLTTGFIVAFDGALVLSRLEVSLAPAISAVDLRWDFGEAL
jgi:hypothetical protein